jgi:hypothetical protein
MRRYLVYYLSWLVKNVPKFMTPMCSGPSVRGLKYFDMLLPLFKPLHDVGCERDKANNRKLHYDQYCLEILLFLFNPIVSSLRALQQASELKNVQKKLGCQRASLGSLSESVSVFDPELLQRIVDQLGEKLRPVQNISRGHIAHTLTAVDGSLVRTLASITEAIYLKNIHGHTKWSGRKPTLRTYEMICYYFIGWANEEELLAHIAKLKPHTA